MRGEVRFNNCARVQSKVAKACVRNKLAVALTESSRSLATAESKQPRSSQRSQAVWQQQEPSATSTARSLLGRKSAAVPVFG